MYADKKQDLPLQYIYIYISLPFYRSKQAYWSLFTVILIAVKRSKNGWDHVENQKYIHFTYCYLYIYIIRIYIYIILATKVNIYAQRMVHFHSGATTVTQPHLKKILFVNCLFVSMWHLSAPQHWSSGHLNIITWQSVV